MPTIRETILACDDLTREEVFIPEWKQTVFVRTMTSGERCRWENMTTGQKRDDILAHLAVMTCVDESGDPIFQAGDVQALMGKSGVALDRILAAALRVNAIRQSDVDELAKN